MDPPDSSKRLHRPTFGEVGIDPSSMLLSLSRPKFFVSATSGEETEETDPRDEDEEDLGFSC